MTSPSVSILMPVRDGELWLQPALDSALGQTFTDFELLVIDDGSSDATPAILAEYAGRDSRIRVLHRSRDGVIAALNHGLAEAKGNLIARLDADDIARPDRLQWQLAFLDEHPEVVLLGSWATRIDADGRVTGALRPELEDASLRKILARTNPFINSSMVFPTSLARQLGGYRAAFDAAEDYDLWLRLSEAGAIANVPEPLVEYRTHPSNVSGTKVVRQIFSSRLALRCAALRRAGAADPAAEINSPPDWNAVTAPTSSYAEDARICRFLAFSDRDYADRNILPEPLAELSALLPKLSHRERKIAQYALLNLAAKPGIVGGLSKGAAIAGLLRLHPLRGATLVTRWLAKRSASPKLNG